ncbi:hypothetical protein SDC9_108396 [bioreactor metagenome]|uniref:Uncharacterized protein n=1 Tax=bioreactor metagenome TaxID=1076179 RepID=A0A645B902_9ZZZZ
MNTAFFARIVGHDMNAMRINQMGRTFNQLYLVAFDQFFYAAAQLVNNIVLALHDFVPIISIFTDKHTKFFRVGNVVPLFCTFQQSLGRDAASVQTNPAQILLFNQQNLSAKLCGTNCGDVTAGTCSDYTYLIVHFSASQFYLFSVQASWAYFVTDNSPAVSFSSAVSSPPAS